MKIFRNYKMIIVSAILFLALAAGCGKKTDTQTANDSSAVQQDKVKQQMTDDATAPGSTGKTENTIPGNELGMTAGLPPDFPSDVPQPKNAKVIGSLMSSDGMVVNFRTAVPVKELVEFYKVELTKNGFEPLENNDLVMKDVGGMMGFKKGSRDVQFMMSSNEDTTSVVITYK